MNRVALVLVVSIFFAACVGSPYRIAKDAQITRIKAEHNRENLIKLNIGQTKDQVLLIMGQPYKTEMYLDNGKTLEFWLYLTEGVSAHSPKGFTDSNFTPLAFESGILKGWGRNYYDNQLRVKKDITIDQRIKKDITIEHK